MAIFGNAFLQPYFRRFMHVLVKIKWYRVLLRITYPIALVIVLPLALLKKKGAPVIFFFDRYAMGGAQRVHLDILTALKDRNKKVFFTRSSADDVLKEAFYSSPQTSCRDIHHLCENILLRLFTVHYFAFYVNRHKNAIVLGSNSTFYYDMLPFLNKQVKRMELLHFFTYGKRGLEFFGLKAHQWLDQRILVDYATREKIGKQYEEYDVPSVNMDKVMVIEPGVFIPAEPIHKAPAPLRVLYAGRGGEQKRVWLIDRIAQQCMEQNLPVVFHFAGTMEEDLSEAVKSKSIMHGSVKDPEKMRAIYAESHVLLMTSSYEGFPMVIKEAMAMGCIPVVTALEGNKTHLNSTNSILLEDVMNEDAVVRQGLDAIKLLLSDHQKYKTLSQTASDYARASFGMTRFYAAYQQLYS